MNNGLKAVGRTVGKWVGVAVMLAVTLLGVGDRTPSASAQAFMYNITTGPIWVVYERTPQRTRVAASCLGEVQTYPAISSISLREYCEYVGRSWSTSRSGSCSNCSQLRVSTGPGPIVTLTGIQCLTVKSEATATMRSGATTVTDYATDVMLPRQLLTP